MRDLARKAQHSLDFVRDKAAPLQECDGKYWLLDMGQGLYLSFQRLVVLALDLKFGLELLDE